ncbi:uncharacterized protein C12orf56 homolog isoform X3 [Callorhinchus milii]|uniref:uncharacterized protein C12orf56 homolog isoform X3 n=1 Tax=Callorhinchus milii TaxID=7868 RepID=UPI001C3F76D7|nr:uncharacterized protein C12orf56 homolog isoform X3 [Callorhinchus milii]
MAAKDRDISPSRRNNKLDFFLKRHLEESVYEKIRGYEVCIVVSETRQKVFQYVVLTDESVYLTEHPPKTIHKAVHLSDVVAIELVDDYANFLKSQNRESTQHIRIIYISRTVKKSQSKNQLFSPIHSNARRRSSVLCQEEAVSGESSWTRGLGTGKHLNEDCIRQQRGFSEKLNTGLKNLTDSTVFGKLDKDNETSRLSSTQVHRPLPQPPVKEYHHSTEPGPSLPNTVLVEQLPCTSHDCLRTKETPISFGLGNWSQVPNALSINFPDVPTTKLTLNPEQDKKRTKFTEEKESELHLYVLSMSSPLYLLLKSSWNNYMIQSTLMQDPDYTRRLSLSSSPGRSQKMHSLEETFNQLSSELLRGHSTLKQISLIQQELQTIACRNYTIKKLFWKSLELYPFLVRKLQEYLPKSQNIAAQHNKNLRVDELRLCVLIVQTLGVMLRETDTEPTRQAALNFKRGKSTSDLLVVLLSEPLIPKSSWLSGTKAPVPSAGSDKSEDVELQKVLTGYNDAATAVLFEIILTAHQVIFIEHMMKRLIKTVTPPLDTISPAQVLLLFQQFYILNTCIQYNTDLAAHIKNEYNEEFRYYIQSPAVEMMLPAHLAITKPTIRLIQEVLGFVFHKQKYVYTDARKKIRKAAYLHGKRGKTMKSIIHEKSNHVLKHCLYVYTLH